MAAAEGALERLSALLPALLVLVIALTVVSSAWWLFVGRSESAFPERRIWGRLVVVVLGLCAVIAVVSSLPLEGATRGQILGLIGLILSAVLTLSSTTFVSNAMAGMMLRAVRNFRPGDFVLVGEHFGRVSERGLLHTEIQTEERDLTTLPNLYLVTNPVKVVRSSGTIVSATVSLGYDVPRTRIEEALRTSVSGAGLEEPFVQILELGDFSVTYRAAGFLTDVKTLLSARSRLRASMLDALHAARIEIVSPTFTNRRNIAAEVTFIPREEGRQARAEGRSEVPEAIIFDKADKAESRARMEKELGRLEEEIATLSAAAKTASDEERASFEERKGSAERRRDGMKSLLTKESSG